MPDMGGVSRLAFLALLLASGTPLRAGALVVDERTMGAGASLSLSLEEARGELGPSKSLAEAGETFFDDRLPGLVYHQEESSLSATSHLAHHADNATAATGDKKAGGSGASMAQIFTLCVVMYGGIAAMWALYWRLPEDHPAKIYGKVFLLCSSWASMSIGMQVLNKTLVTMLKAPALISVGQMWIAVLLVGIPSYKELLRAPKNQLLTWLIVPLFFAAMLCTSCYTYQYISLSFYTVIRNMTPLVVLPIERTIMPADKRPRLSAMVIASMGVMLAGAVMYGGGVGHVSIIGCIFALANMFIAVGDRLMQRRLLTTECAGLASTVCTVMNNFFGSIPALGLALATHQISDMSSSEGRAAWTDPRVLSLLVLSGAIGIGICYLGFECQRAISATSFFVLQNVSKVAVIVCGIVFFQDPVHSPLAVSGMAFSVAGSFGYGRAQMLLQEQAKEDQRMEQKTMQQAQAQKSV